MERDWMTSQKKVKNGKENGDGQAEENNKSYSISVSLHSIAHARPVYKKKKRKRDEEKKSVAKRHGNSLIIARILTNRVLVKSKSLILS